jgi:hypothetical protein
MERALHFGLLVLLKFAVWATEAPSLTQTESDDVMGDYRGAWGDAPLCVQVIAVSQQNYIANVLRQFDTRDPKLAVLEGERSEGSVRFSGEQDGTSWKGEITGGVFQGEATGANAGEFRLQRVERLSPTLGAKAPKGAVILFNGADLEDWMHIKPDHSGPEENAGPCRWKLLDNGAMEVRGGGILSKHTFTNHRLHLEFRTPFRPESAGQDRGNSGVFLQGRYEVQILDSYGLEGQSNECGAIYGIARPLVNMAAPPLQWQTYDITFRAPRFDENGEKIQDAILTVLHNGVMIHENQKVPHPTSGSVGSDIHEPQGLHLQDIGNPVQYRNIWAVELN